MAREGRLAPESFINPSLPLYLTMPVVWVQERAASAGLLRGRAADPLLAARVLAAVAAAAAVLLLGVAASRGVPGEGLLAAALLALAPAVVNLGHFATPEAWLLLGSAATVLLALRHAEGRVPAVVLGIAVGLTGATKYTAAALLVPALIAVALRRRPTWRAAEAAAVGALGLACVAAGGALAGPPGHRLAASLHLPDLRLLRAEQAASFVAVVAAVLIAAGALALLGALLAWRGSPRARRVAHFGTLALLGGAALGFVFGTPYALVEPRAFLSDLAYNHQTRHEYKGLVGASTSFGPYVRLLSDALTGPVLAAAVVGLVVAAVRARTESRWRIVVVASAVAPYLLVASSGHRALRFLVPCLPAFAALAAFALRALPQRSARAPLTAFVLARAALGALLVVRLFFVDSRGVSARWLERHAGPGAPIDLIANNPGYGPALPEGRLRVVPTLSREMAPPERFQEAAARYPAEAAEWLVLTASYYQRFLDHPEQAPERARFFEELLAGRGGFEVVERFRQEGWRRPGADEFLDPEIVVLKKRR
jgi:hypothetical protein